MKLNFCTLFNSNYVSRGLVMYESLLEHCADFHLYVFAFDDKTFEFLKSQNYPQLTVISLKEFEDGELLRVKPDRSAAEYCWTCTASTILFSINKFGLDNCTYLDADMCFYSDPSVLIEEMGDKSVLITGHRYTPEYDHSVKSGKYCVQFVTFKNDENGMEVLSWWRNACIEWCYARHEDGKFGDQKYLDDWTTRFKGVHDLQHLGGGLAPWNIQQYSFSAEDGKLKGEEYTTGEKFEAVFFHFHGLRLFENNMVMITGSEYELSKDVKRLLYGPYLREIQKARAVIAGNPAGKMIRDTAGKSSSGPMSIFVITFYYLRDLKRSIKNIFGKTLSYHLKHHSFFRMNDL
ncbi:MAG TPA: glycosyl transferase [Bacteroidia bacterium]|jgi:hypothetical protein